MSTLKKVLMGVIAIAALGLGGAALAGATSGDGGGGGGAAEERSADEQVTGAAASKAGAAASQAVGGGDVLSVERSDEGGKAVYEVKVKHDGTVTEVNLDSAYGVTAQQVDDDQGGQQGDGDGETNDD